MNKKWIQSADRVGDELKNMPGKLVGVAVDNDIKADFFIKHWQKDHPHVEVIDRNHVLGECVFMRVRLKGNLQ